MMDITHKRRIIWLFLAIFWMILIFCFSHQKADDSGALSGSLSYRLAEEINLVLGLDWEEETLLQYATEWEHPVRKAAHMTEYGVFACILLGNCVQYPILYKRKYVWALFGVTIYASTDEFHQLFVEGRSGEFKDVCIDTTGAMIGLLLAWIFICLWKKNKRKR